MPIFTSTFVSDNWSDNTFWKYNETGSGWYKLPQNFENGERELRFLNLTV